MILILNNWGLTYDVLSTTKGLVEETDNARPLTAVSDDPEDLTALTPNLFLLGQKIASALFLPPSERYNDLKNFFQNSSSICRHGLEKMESRVSPTMETEIEVVRRTWAKPERMRASMASRWLCKALWVQTAVTHWDFHCQQLCSAISESSNGTWRAEPPVVKLAPLFYDDVSEI